MINLLKNKNKKGQSLLDVIVFIVFAIIIVVFFGLLIYVFGIMNTQMHNIQTPPNNLGINLTDTFDRSIGNLDAGINTLNLVGFCLIFGMVLTILISSFLVKSHPVFFVGYLFVTVLGIILSIAISNGYQQLITDPNLYAVFTTQNNMGNFIMLYLPIWVTIIGFIGAILLFSGMMSPQDTGQGGLG